MSSGRPEVLTTVTMKIMVSTLKIAAMGSCNIISASYLLKTGKKMGAFPSTV
jgi:hypothetical protein